MSKETWISTAVLVGIGLAGCAAPLPMTYTDIASSKQWSANAQDSTGRMPFSYKRAWGGGHYGTIILEPVILYTAPDNQLGDLKIGEIMPLKKQMDAEFRQALSRYFRVSDKLVGESAALRVRITLTGVQRNTAFLTTFSRFDFGLGSYNFVQSLRDKKGTFSGSVFYTVEVYDESRDILLQSFAAHQYPTVYDISATRGSMSAAQAGVTRGAKELAEELSRYR